jgi:hypothetical protein
LLSCRTESSRNFFAAVLAGEISYLIPSATVVYEIIYNHIVDVGTVKY